ncbi:MAG: hypothetical protein IPI55_10675 [Flavobacteriales bacterium]|nr:hypothetical protein [Flavobacteriales bacterium]
MNEYSSDTTFWLYKYIKGDLVLVRNYKGNSGFRIDNYWRYQYLDDRIIRTDSMYHASNEYYQVTRVTSIYEKNTAGQVSAMLEKIERIHPIQHGLETKSFFTYTDGFCTREDVQYNNGYSYYKPITLE